MKRLTVSNYVQTSYFSLCQITFPTASQPDVEDRASCELNQLLGGLEGGIAICGSPELVVISAHLACGGLSHNIPFVYLRLRQVSSALVSIRGVSCVGPPRSRRLQARGPVPARPLEG